MGEESHSRGCSKSHPKVLLVTQLLGRALAQRQCLPQNIWLSSAQETWSIFSLLGCTQVTRQVGVSKSYIPEGKS